MTSSRFSTPSAPMRLVTSKRAAGAPMTSTCLAPWSRATAVAKLPSGPAPLDDHDFVALDRSQPLETMHHGPVRAGGCRRRGGGDFFGDFDDQTRRRHVHVFGAASEEIGEPVAPVMPHEARPGQMHGCSATLQ